MPADGTSSRYMFNAAAALASVLERLSAHYRDLKHFRATREELIETCARILKQTLVGH